MSDLQPPPTISELRTRMERAFTAFRELIEPLSSAEMLEPVDAAGWNVRDHLTHLAVWAEGIAALLRREERWAAMGLPPAVAGDLDYEAINAQIRARQQHVAPAAARERLVAAHEGVLAAVETLADGDLLLPYERFVAPYTGDGGQPILGYIMGNTAGHYEEHAGYIRALVAK